MLKFSYNHIKKIVIYIHGKAVLKLKNTQGNGNKLKH